MKNFLNNIFLLKAALFVLTMAITACGSDDDLPAPRIELKEANIEGDELCVEADIVAQGRTAAINIVICDVKGQTTKVAYPVTASSYIGVLNINDFHVHVPIASKNVVVGDLLQLTVIDAQGLTTTAQKSITEEDDDDDAHHD